MERERESQRERESPYLRCRLAGLVGSCLLLAAAVVRACLGLALGLAIGHGGPETESSSSSSKSSTWTSSAQPSKRRRPAFATPRPASCPPPIRRPPRSQPAAALGPSIDAVCSRSVALVVPCWREMVYSVSWLLWLLWWRMQIALIACGSLATARGTRSDRSLVSTRTMLAACRCSWCSPRWRPSDRRTY